MKTFKNYKIIAFFFALIIAISCVSDDDFDIPNTEPTVPVLDGTIITIGSLKGLVLQNDGTPLTFSESNLYISGYVISNDEAGNFFEEIVIQDNAVNPTTGVKILINVNPLFISYEFGRKIFVKLDGLTAGFSSENLLTIGIIDNGTEIKKIAESLMAETLIRDIELAEIIPLPINISEFSQDKTNLYVRLSDMQFHRDDAVGENQKTFAAEPGDEFDGERILESCTEGFTAIVSTSTYSDFKSVLVPQGRGTLDGILTYNYFGETFNMVLNTPETINFDRTDRCDPTEVGCGLATTTGNNELFSEFFETQNEGDPITGNGWVNYNEVGSRKWKSFSSDATNGSLGISATIGSYQSNDDSTISWLIMPEIDFDAQDGETLNFKTSNSFSDGSKLEVLFSNDWDGNTATIATATWELISAAYIVQDDVFFGDWPQSGNVSLDCIEGTGYIAFKYTGTGDEYFDGSYELDEIVVNSN